MRPDKFQLIPTLYSLLSLTPESCDRGRDLKLKASLGKVQGTNYVVDR